MQQVLTAKLKLEVTQEQKEQLRVTSLAYRDALNYTSGVAFEMGKSYNGTKIQKEVYYTLREKFKLPSQMACNVPRQVGATYKSLLTKLKQNEEAMKAGRTKKTKPRKTGKKASNKQRKANSNKARWSFAELHGFVDYKAVLEGSLAVKVDAHYTSQACPCCGHTSKENRPNKGLTFVCQSCGYTLHADLIGARNVALRVLLSRQDWESTGRFSAVLDASSDESKAERLSRYSELRWTIDAISNLSVVEPSGEA